VREVRAWLLVVAVALAGCPSTQPKRQTVVEEPAPKKKKKKVAATTGSRDVLHGRAVWYGGGLHGGPTASGERFDKRAMTAAHRDLPLGTKVRVTNKRNGKSVIVRINDRGPYGKDRRRIIDVSEGAAKILDFIDAGWTEVRIDVLERPPPKAKKKKKNKKK
jgi:rare lipoprotein A